ncbi:MAG TPA: protein kinase [Ktedonobacteraceae bacterium]|nr:protein kinase [Ktedonobacteraceae bacterium]
MPRCPNPRCRTDYPPGTFVCTNPFCQCLLPDAVVAGRYRIETLIGLGGMGAVYRTSDTFEMQQVALKVISTAHKNVDEATIVERFRREARYAHQLSHKNIVPVLNFGQDGSLLYLVMPLITGGTLKSLLKGEHPLPTALAQRYLGELAEAIDAIHAHPQRIIHRDIKPSNLLINQNDGRLMITDFGIARAMQKDRPLTAGGFALGTEHYTAPEQGMGNPEPASDIYAMGVVAYQMFTGLLPFQAIVRSHSAILPAPSELNPLLNSAVDAAILKAMDPEPANRFASGKEFAEAVNLALRRGMPVTTNTPTMLVAAGNANVIVRTIIPENPCAACGQENRSSSRFCRRCGHRLDDTSPLVTDVCQVGYVSDTGRRYVAEDNEDMLLIIQGLCANLAPPPRPFGLFAVADGLRGPLGKSAGGHEASRLGIETVADVMVPLLATPLSSSSSSLSPGVGSSIARSSAAKNYQPGPPPDAVLEQWLREAVRRANLVIYHCNADYETTMASTLTLSLVYKRVLYVASVGDSRAYHFSASKGLKRITIDHTLGAGLVEASLFKPEEIYTSPKGKKLYRYLGQSSHVQVDFFTTPVELNDLVLLCTDGLWHMLRDERIEEILSQGGDPQKLARTLVDEANLAGGEGNVSAIVIGIQ